MVREALPPSVPKQEESLRSEQAGWRGILVVLLSAQIRLIRAGKCTHSCLGNCTFADVLAGQPPNPWSPPPGHQALCTPFTCRHKEDAGTKDDVVSGFVELAGCNAESTHEKQNHTQDRENTRGSNSPCRREREGRAERTTQV